MNIPRSPGDIQELSDQERIHLLQMKVHQLEMERMLDKELFASEYLTSGQKVVLHVIRQIISELHIDESTLTVIYRSELVRKTGLSKKQISRITDELDAWGLITKETSSPLPTKDGEWSSETKFSIGGTIKSMKGVTTPRRKAGGDQRCHHCGSKNISKVAYQCKDCGHYGAFDE